MSLNFDSYGRLPDDPSYDGSQLGSMELYNLKIQKLKEVFTDYDAVTKIYVDSKISDLLGGASSAYDTLKELEEAINGADQNVVGGLLKEIGDLSATVATEKARAEGAEGALATRILTLETDNSVSALQSEVNNVEAGAGLSADGQYQANASSNYLSLASSLKDADALLDSALKAEETARATAVSSEATARAGADSALDTRIGELELDPTTQGEVDIVDGKLTAEVQRAENAEDFLGVRIDDLTTSNVSEGTNQYYSDFRVKNAEVHSYEKYNYELKERDVASDVTTAYALSQVNAEFNDMRAKQNQNVSAISDEVNRAENAETALGGRIDENDSKHSGHDSKHAEHEQAFSENATRHSGHDSAIEGLGQDKFDKEGGSITGDVQHQANAEFQGNVAMNVQGSGKYLYFSERWRLSGKSDGSRLIFEYQVSPEVDDGTTITPAVWKIGVPFISSV